MWFVMQITVLRFYGTGILSSFATTWARKGQINVLLLEIIELIINNK